MTKTHQYSSVQEMLDAIDPEFAEEFRRYQRRPLVRLRKWWWWWLYWIVPRMKRRVTQSGS